jgi:hypothetical protein
MHDNGLNDDISKIDKVIMVAAPQVGTPNAIGALLHGNGTDVIIKGIFPNSSISRDFGKNTPGAYNFLPSEKYFDLISSPVITFDASLNSVNNFYQTYGSSITSYSKFKNFILGILDNRSNPISSDTVSPELLNATLVNNADTIHADLDNYQIPSSITVYKIAGWGKDTASHIAYATRQDCLVAGLLCHSVLDEKMIPTSNGDGTVVTPSAIFGGGVGYYFNLQIRFKNLSVIL